MNLNISNLLNTLQGYYNPKKGTGEKYTGAEEGLNKFISAYGLSGSVISEELTADNLSKAINDLESGVSVTVSSSAPCKYSYKIDNGKIIIFGNNLTIDVDEENEDLIEVVGISNVINATSKDDKITLIGYDNKVNANDGNDNVTVYGNDNKLKDSEINIFSGVGGQTLIFGDKTFEIGMKDSTEDNSSIQISALETGEITLNAQNAKIIAQDDKAEDITLIGDNNYLDTSAGSDNIKVKGDKNIIITGDDDGIDTVEVEGKENTVSGDNTDVITYKGSSGSINLTKADEASHYIEIEISEGVSRRFYIERNSSSTEDVEISYSVNDDKQIVFTCNNAKIFAQDDTNEEIIVNGNNNYIDASAGNDKIVVNGDNNIIIPGDDGDDDEISINGNENRISGDNGDTVYYTGASGSITLSKDDEASHYITVNGVSYFVERNPVYDSNDDVIVSYKVNEQGVFELNGDNFSIKETNDEIEDNIKITGNNNYVDTGDKDDNITIIGDSNVVTAGSGDDSVVVIGKNNKISGDAGIDTIASNDESNVTEDTFEIVDKIITLKSDYQAETVKTKDNKTYDLKLSPTAIKDQREVNIIFRERDGKVIIEADNIIVEAGKKQEDDITFKGNNSKIYAADKNDVINVIGDNNNVDGWTGDDKITVTGRNNQAYGFLGNDEINIIQRESAESEIAEEVKNVSDKDDEGNVRKDEEKQNIAKDNLAKSGANKVDGEFGTDTVTATSSNNNPSIYKYTDVSVKTEISKSLSQSVKLKPEDDEKRVVLADESGKTYSYTIKNHISLNNPFVGTRTISYDFVDITDENGNTTKQLVVQGDYIEVIADDAQEDNIKIIGDGNKVDLGDEMDYLEAQGNYNLIFVGKGNDNVNVTGNNNEIYGDEGDDILSVDGSGNKVSAGKGNDVLKLYGDSFEAFGDDGDDVFDVSAINSKIYGGNGVNTVSSTQNGIETNTFRDFANDPTPKMNEDLLILSPTNLNGKINIAGLTFDVKPNISNLAGEIYIRYKIQTDENGEPQLLIKGNTFIMNLDNSENSVNVKIIGDDIAFYSYSGNDKIEVIGNKNKIDAGKGGNIINLNGNYNTITCGRSLNDTDAVSINNISVNGNYNTVENVNMNDNVIMTGINNNEKSLYNGERTGGSFVLTNTLNKQTLVMQDRAYEITIFGIKEDELKDANINVRYDIDEDGYINFYANNVKIRVIDSESAKANASIVLNGSNCCLTGGYGEDAIKIRGNNNIIDGWYGDDSFEIYGENNDIRGYDGNDTANIFGDKNTFNGEQGEDTMIVVQGKDNKAENIEKLENLNK